MDDGITLEELQLAARNHGLPLESLRQAITPVGLHYLLIHFDIPVVDAALVAPSGRRAGRAAARAQRSTSFAGGRRERCR